MAYEIVEFHNGMTLDAEHLNKMQDAIVDLEDDISSRGGVYVGSGDIPEGYNVQIDPEGEPDEVVATQEWVIAKIQTVEDTLKNKLDANKLQSSIDTALTQATEELLASKTWTTDQIQESIQSAIDATWEASY